MYQNFGSPSDWRPCAPPHSKPIESIKAKYHRAIKRRRNECRGALNVCRSLFCSTVSLSMRND